MFGFKKHKKPTLKELTTSVSLALDDAMSADGDELLRQSGLTRQQLLDKIKSDDKVESSIEDLRGQINKATWRIWGEDSNEDQINVLYKLFTRHFDAFIELALTAKLNGFAIAEYLFEKDARTGFVSLAQVLDKDGELDNYALKRGARLFFYSDSGEVEIETELKHLVLTSQATIAKPEGRALIARAYPAVMLRQKNFPYASQFLSRYAQPYLIGKQGNLADQESFVEKLYALISGGAGSIGVDDEVQMLLNPANGEFFQQLEKMCNARIEDLLLGKVKTSNLEHGSRSAQETEEDSRKGRVASLAKLVAKGIQHALDALIEVNRLYGVPITAPDGLWFEFLEQAKVDVDRADRDKKYLDTGQVRLTKEYFVNIVGYEEEHVEIVDSAGQINTHDERLSLSANSEACACGHCASTLTLSGNLSDDFSDNGAAHDDVKFDAEQALLAPKIDAIFSALNASEGFEEFNRRLDDIQLSDQKLIDDMTLKNAKAVADGLTEKS